MYDAETRYDECRHLIHFLKVCRRLGRRGTSRETSRDLGCMTSHASVDMFRRNIGLGLKRDRIKSERFTVRSTANPALVLFLRGFALVDLGYLSHVIHVPYPCVGQNKLFSRRFV